MSNLCVYVEVVDKTNNYKSELINIEPEAALKFQFILNKLMEEQGDNLELRVDINESGEMNLDDSIAITVEDAEFLVDTCLPYPDEGIKKITRVQFLRTCESLEGF